MLLGNLDTINRSAAAAPGGRPSTSATGGYGPLVNDPAGRLALPRGFRYTVVTEAGATKLESGHPTPADADGTASFVGSDTSSILVNNHEVGSNQDTDFPVPLPGRTYLRSGRQGRDHDHSRQRRGQPDPRIRELVRYRQQLCRRPHTVEHVVDL
ncbi:secreted PhoX family phosphatase [Saccharopolyspora lacisalsi]|uniref:Secreted PhoX family phosphatase n=1 Tax=Halosaccharopolyspora lacisalsi TaxID=1000566 RepID=A0A839DPC6_9PSEU|nr:alkaline phosphatase PhoX [Halosaccharopolyspora lacisalsi]MBA8823842.1 secreted PhoX family phosphatase [Halosaccharopolyspora lacisalsi]